MTSLDVYELNLANSGKLKLRATARLADGDPGSVFEACVLMHEAARVEHRAIASLERCSPATRLAASIEECYCLIEGRDPPGAGKVWGRILRERGSVDESTAEAMMQRVAFRYPEQSRQFAKLLAGCPTLLSLRRTAGLVPTSAGERKKALRELARVLRQFPGVPSFWWARYRISDANDELAEAWDALSKAHRLEPENPRFAAMSLFLAVRALPSEQADAHIAQVYAELDSAGAEVSLMYAIAEIEMADRDRDRERLVRAREALWHGLSVPRPGNLSVSLKATQLVVECLLAGETPTLETLYRAGLGKVAAGVAPSTDTTRLVMDIASRSVVAADDFNAAAA